VEEQRQDQPQETQSSEENKEIVKTLFVTGFPTDVKPREIYNLFRFHPGFQHCVLNYKGPAPAAFAAFDSQVNAIKAKDALQGIKFDFESRVELRLEMAKSNSYGPKGQADGKTE